MAEYLAPLRDMAFVLHEIAGLGRVAQLPGCEEASADVVEAILAEAARFAGAVLSPLNRVGDRAGTRCHDGVVTMPPGFGEAYRQFIDGGWNGLGCDPAHGGQGLPGLVSAAVQEMWKSANMAFSLCSMLTLGAAEALERFGSAEQKAMFLPKLVAGSWTGTMNITEPQAGSDLGAIRCRAEPRVDGSYKLFGQKIFISYGEHDLAENIIHLVLARLPGAPEGVKGLSLLLVPKFLVEADGTLGPRNDLRCVSIEHKLGIHASPTAVMSFGDDGGATGHLVGPANAGLEAMFVMMNAARFAVGLEGLGLSERAYQQALAHAKERVQGREIGGAATAVPIVRHPDVRRMLMSMKSRVEAMRALAYFVAAAQDVATRHPDAAERQRNQACVDLMVPVVKGWFTENAVDIASLGMQVHGGMGYIEETGAAQHLRDARITTIYEGTTGIQASDLLWRKIHRDGGAALGAACARMRQTLAELEQSAGADFAAIHAAFAHGVAALEEAAAFVVAHATQDSRGVAVGAVPLLNLMGIVSGGWMMARSALAARRKSDAGNADSFLEGKIVTARFYADHVLAAAPGLAWTVTRGSPGALALGEEQF
ncbi:acyl-CoA dehydrogenase [Sulfurisoma sediminicola]|uniref:3-methylmercaptopropionyl-CoA dehydrogenase n=1 Tax=Sulfurisoma sediminicola TaxID=1381557 RepID=A0A497XGM0_9PROT|nr:acyl-CoA dehydrogenase [Sulfurisoma sediminicola]RLJ65157.1 hypothetical protein DFR35_1813 [Sulfurisoma sediminicola]